MSKVKSIQVLMRDTDDELLAYWGSKNGIRGKREDDISQTPQGGTFVGKVCSAPRAERCRDIPVEAGYRHATLGEVMQFLRHCLEAGVDSGVAADDGLAAIATTIWLPGSFYGTPYCLQAHPRCMEMTDGRFGFPGGRCLIVEMKTL